jgi:hypothetical protein
MSAIAQHRAGRGTTEIYGATLAETWEAAHLALKWDGAGRPEDHPDRRYMITNHPSSDEPSFNDQVGVWLQPLGPYKTRVDVVVMSAPEPANEIIGPDESTLQKDIAKAIALLQRGEALAPPRPE